MQHQLVHKPEFQGVKLMYITGGKSWQGQETTRQQQSGKASVCPSSHAHVLYMLLTQ